MSNTECGTADLALALRLLHVLRAWSWTPGNETNPARQDILYPHNNGRNELWKRIDALLERHPYRKPDSASPVTTEKT